VTTVSALNSAAVHAKRTSISLSRASSVTV